MHHDLGLWTLWLSCHIQIVMSGAVLLPRERIASLIWFRSQVVRPMCLPFVFALVRFTNVHAELEIFSMMRQKLLSKPYFALNSVLL